MRRRGWLLLPALLLLAGLVSGQVQRVPTSGASLAPLTSDGTHVTLGSGQLRLPDGSAGAPSVAFSAETNTGLRRSGTSVVDTVLAGNARFRINASGALILNDTGGLYWGNNADLVLARDAANTLAQRNGANAQLFNIYNTFTDGSNFERGFMRWSSNIFEVGTSKLGTGTARPFSLMTDGTLRWQIQATSGHLFAGADNTYDLGASGATRPRTGYFGTSVISGNGSASAPAFAFAGSTNSGLAASGSTPYLVAGGTAVVAWNGVSNRLESTQFLGWSSGNPVTDGSDVALKRNAAGLIEVNSGTAAAYRDLRLRALESTGYAFASLPASTNGSLTYCTDCNASTSPCTSGGTGALAVRQAGAWRCL